MSDVWEMVNGAEDGHPDQDPDEDGMTNRLEAVAGTNPFDERSVPKISLITATANGVRVTMPGAFGKRYDLQASELLCGSTATNWFTGDSLVARTNSVVWLNAPADLPTKFFRVVVSDIDTDGDGLNDWEEYQLGSDPMAANSTGELDVNGQPISDYQRALKVLKLETTKEVAAGPAAAASLIIYPAAAATGTGLTGQYFTNSSTLYSGPENFNPANLVVTRTDPVIDFLWEGGMSPNVSDGLWTVRWTGQVEPQYSETYVFDTHTDDGVKLWINDQLMIDKWVRQHGTGWTNAITLQAGVRYNVKMEFFNGGNEARAQLYWFSANQPWQIIPTSRLYPASEGLAPGAVTSPLSAVAFLGQPFSYTITGANSSLGYGATNLPPALTFNPTNGVISGIPTLAGGFDVSIAVSNSVGIADAMLHIEVIDTGSSITREVWTNAIGISITNIPLYRAASLTNTLGNLEGILNFGDNYGERIRGYLTAPATGNYYFWIAANNSAELWISNDDEPVNKVRRAYVSKATAPRQWNLLPTQKSAWLALEGGKRYYIEVLHKAGAGANDHWSVGWLRDSTGTNTVPSGVVPGYVLSQFVETPPAEIPGTLYSANMVAQSGVLSSGVGSATLRLSADGSQAVLRFNYSGLSAPVTAKHIHADSYLGKNSQGQIVFDIDTATPEPDGSYVWNIVPVGTLSSADLVEIIKEGKSYINVHSVNYPAGEINGHFCLADGTATFIAPPSPPVWTNDHSSSNAAARFLLQATFGPSPTDIKLVQSLGYKRWIDNQISLRASSHLPNVVALGKTDPNTLFLGSTTFNTWWQRSVTAPDQLRQRVAFALSEIMVVSEEGVLADNPIVLSCYYDVLLQRAFGNFRDLLKAVTLSPAMGSYLDMRGNDKGDMVRGTNPNENYAREILQLFSVGLNRMWPDGTLVLNSKGDLVPTYDQNTIIGYSRVFTGWNYYQPNQPNGRLPVNWFPAANYTSPMVLVPTRHEMGDKRLLDNVILPSARGAQANPINVSFDTYCLQDLDRALDTIFYNENVGPFICRQLIQRLVTSHPSRDYIYRVVQKFNNNGMGVRGDMKAVITAILLDYEARSTNVLIQPTYGKQREPLLRATSLARAFPSPPPLGGSYKQSGSTMITVTTSKAHRLNTGDNVLLTFTGSPAPKSQVSYVEVITPTAFQIYGHGIAFGTYSQSGNIITVTSSGHGLNVGQQTYLTFMSGGAPGGIYTLATVPSGSVFTVTNAVAAIRSGNCAFPKWTGCDSSQSGSNITFATVAPHGLKVGSKAYIVFSGGNASTNGVYKITKVPDVTHFTVISSVSANRADSGALVLPLTAAPVNRSGTVTLQYNAWQMNYTDSGGSSSLAQTPLNSPTVFNFFFPDYKFPGILASAGLTTPEFQLTSDTSIIMQMNFMSGGIFNNSGNTNGLTSFNGGNGSITLDIGPWLTPAWTSDAGIPWRVDALNSRLCAGQLSPDVKTVIVGYVVNPRFPYSVPAPTFAQMRDRVRAVVHLIVTSPDFAIQR